MKSLRHHSPTVLSMLSLLLLTACLGAERSQEVQSDELVDLYEKRVSTVSALILQSNPFHQEILSQGTVMAVKMADIPFAVQGTIEELPIVRGQFVEKGQILAKISDSEQRHQLNQLYASNDELNFKIEAKLTSMGLPPDTSQIAQQLLRNLRLEVGWYSLRERINHAKWIVEQSSIRAPKDGVVTDLVAMKGNFSSGYDKLCTIVDDRTFFVQFTLFEEEARALRLHQAIDIVPIYDTTLVFTARLASIDPVVDDIGLVSLYANVNGGRSKLRHGTKVRVAVKKTMPNQWVVPKSAVVEKQGAQVVFVYRRGQAHWTYVTLAAENRHAYALLTPDLHEGDTLIVSNNIGLLHQALVVIDTIIS